MNFIKIVTIICVANIFSYPSCADSLQHKPGMQIEAFLATSFIFNKNWKEGEYSSLVLSGNLKILSSEKKTNRITELRAELMYMKFIDSIWVKTNDKIGLTNIWLLTENKIKQSVTLSVNSQLTDTWIENINGSRIERRWKSGPLLPASVLFSYGVLYKSSPANYLNVSFPSAKFSSIPVGNMPDRLDILLIKPQYLLYEEFGVNVIVNIDKKFNRHFSIESNSNCFVTRKGKLFYLIETRNIVAYIPVAKLKFRLDSRFQFDSKSSEEAQWKYDFLFGMNLEF